MNFKFSVFGNYLAAHALDIVNAVFLDSSAIKLVKVFTGGTNINIKYINIRVGVFFTGKHCVFCGIHTANL